MEIKNNVKELLEIFLSHNPNGDGERDRCEFVKFASELARNKESIYEYHDNMINEGVHEDWFEELAIASEWIALTVKMLEE